MNCHEPDPFVSKGLPHAVSIIEYELRLFVIPRSVSIKQTLKLYCGL